MNYWEPSWPAALLTIALLLMGAIVIGELIGWAPADDREPLTHNDDHQSTEH